MNEREDAVVKLREVMNILKEVDNLAFGIDDRRYPDITRIRSMLAFDVGERLYAIERMLLAMDDAKQ